ncbi:MAG TPA: hypothetical protein DIS66_04975 [Candidatus Omnitrophica bacterium]|nr:hypothetical protein [Candidatus Omnitrophota bacterium]
MKKFFALLTIGLLITAGLRAPESSALTNGFCTSGPVLEKAQGHDSDSHELRRVASDPTTLHSGFAPSFHPFDMPKAQAISAPEFSGSKFSDFVPSLGGMSVFPLIRPPVAFSF